MLLPFTDGLMVTSPFDPEMAKLADRHYSRRKVGSPQFANNGRKLILRNAEGTVLFVWMYPRPELRWDHQRGYNCAMFRNESVRQSSDLIREAEAFAFEKWGPNRLYTYVDASKIRSPNAGYCFQMAGWTKHKERSKTGKILLSKEDPV